jgi:hypothetical protein
LPVFGTCEEREAARVFVCGGELDEFSFSERCDGTDYSRKCFTFAVVPQRRFRLRTAAVDGAKDEELKSGQRITSNITTMSTAPAKIPYKNPIVNPSSFSR